MTYLFAAYPHALGVPAEILAEVAGIEPTITESKSVVLPLDDTSVYPRICFIPLRGTEKMIYHILIDISHMLNHHYTCSLQ